MRRSTGTRRRRPIRRAGLPDGGTFPTLSTIDAEEPAMVQTARRATTPTRRCLAAALVACCLLLTAGCARRSPEAAPSPAGPATTGTDATAPSGTGPSATPGTITIQATGTGTGGSPGTAPSTGPAIVPAVPSPPAPAGYPGDAKVYAQDAVLAWQHGTLDRLRQLTTATAAGTLTARPGTPDPTWTYRMDEGVAGSTYVTFGNASGGTMVVRVSNQLLGKPQAVDEVRF